MTNINYFSQNFEGTPLSLSNANNGGTLNPRLYLIPRLTLSPYGLVDFYIHLKPYLGVEMWDASPLTNPTAGSITTGEFNEGSRPSNPIAPTLLSVTASSILVELPPPSSSFDIDFYEVKYDCVTCYDYFFTDFLYPSSLGFFYRDQPNCLASAPLSENSFATSEDNEGTVLTCANLCTGTRDCYMFTWAETSKMCILYSFLDSYPFTSDTSCTSWRRTTTPGQNPIYELRHQDILGYVATTDGEDSQVEEYVELFLGSYYTFTPYEYAIHFRASSAKGMSEWSSATNALIQFPDLVLTIYDNIDIEVTWSTNLAIGETVLIRIYEDDSIEDDLIMEISVLLDGSNAVTYTIGDFYTECYFDGDSNSQHLYATIGYAENDIMMTSDNSDYYPVSSLYYSSTSSSVYFSFTANKYQIEEVEVVLTYFGITYYSQKFLTSSICNSNNFCSFSYTYSNTGSYTATLYAYDASGYYALIDSFTTASSFAQPPSNGALDQTIGTADVQANGNGVATAPIFPEGKTKISDETQSSTSSRRLAGENLCPVESVNGLSYSFYIGVSAVVGMQEIVIPGWGLLIMEALESPEFVIISPTTIPYDFAEGCLEFPELAPQLVCNSPKSGDFWGLDTNNHVVQWSYWSIPDDAIVDVCFYTASGSMISCGESAVAAEFQVSLPSESFTAGDYYVTITYGDVVENSDVFSVGDASGDLGAAATVSFEATPHDDDVVPFEGLLVKLGPVSISLKTGSMCQSQYKIFPMNILCTLLVDLTVDGFGSIYTFHLNGGANIESEEELRYDFLK